MEQLLLKSIANDIILALHDKAIAGSPNKFQVSAPAHAKLLEGSNLASANRKHPKVPFLRWYSFYWVFSIQQGLDTCDDLQSVCQTPLLFPI